MDRLEAAFVRLVDVQVAQKERMDGLNERVDDLRGDLRTFREAVTDRLDRLIAITLKERTAAAERFGSIEERLTRLERHAGF